MRKFSLLSVFGCLLFAAMLSPAFTQSDFYRGKTVSIVVGTRLT